MKRTAVTAVLLLTPVQANASYLVYEVAQDMFAALGEASGYMEPCRPDLDRSLFRRAKVLGDYERMFSENELRVMSLSYDVGLAQGRASECSHANGLSLKTRVSTAMNDLKVALEKYITSESAKIK